MNISATDIDPDTMMSLMLDGISEIEMDDLAYLFATGKSELEIRNQIALHLHKFFGAQYVVAREWKRHDLVVLEHGRPQILVEGKSWIHADAVNPQKMYSGNNSIIAGLERDIKKMLATEHANCQINKFVTTILFTVDLARAPKQRVDDAAISYANTHRKAILEHENAIELAGRGRGALSNLLTNYGIVKRAQLNAGYFHEFKVEADFFLLKPDSITFLEQS